MENEGRKMDNYQAMNFYYGLLNLQAGLFKVDLCGILMLVAQNVPDNDEQPATAYHPVKDDQPSTKQSAPAQVKFGSFYEDGHILHNVKIEPHADFFLDPTRGDTVKWHVSFTVAKDVRPADQFIIQLSDNLMVAASGYLQQPIPDFVDQTGVAIAMGEYKPHQHQLVYTFTNYVTDHRQITGEITGELAIDPVTTPENKFGLPCFISVDDYRKDFTIDVDYPDLGSDTFLGISSRMMAFDEDKHIFTDLIYVNPAQQELNHAYIVFNTSELVEELSNAIVKPSTIRLEIYRNSYGLKLPQSYGVNLQRLREVTNQFPVVEGDHLVDTPMTISFADNKMRLNFAADNTNDSFIIKVVGQYDDELAGMVRLRARLFGVDQHNVYMSNATEAKAAGVAMQVSGQAIAKDESQPAMDQPTSQPVAATSTPVQPTAVADPEPVEEETPTPVENSTVAQAVDEETVEPPIIDESEEDSSATEVMATEESGSAESEVAQPTTTPVSAADSLAEPDSSAYVVSFDEPVNRAAESGATDGESQTPASEESVSASSLAPEESQSVVSEAPASTTPAPDQPAIGADDLSISFTVPAAAKSATESAMAVEPATDDEPGASEASDEPALNREAEAANAPLPSRRPPRRANRFQTNGRAGHGMRHLRRF